MSYHLLTYSLLFLPAVILMYQLTPQKIRWVTLLVTDYIFFWLISGGLIIWMLAATLVTYVVGRVIAYVAENSTAKGKELVRKKRMILGCGVILTLGMLVVFKYLKVFGITFIAPIGISYYTLQTISYMTDVYRGTVKAETHIGRLALYLSFFPQIMEGPISRFNETAYELFSGKELNFHNVAFGYQRILWGLFKKMLIADRLAPAVFKVFSGYENYDGSAVAVGVIFYTMQLYMEFSGCMDIIIGTGEIFGVVLPENFRQPFFAKNASDFWRRWHITLGTWLKDYVFYPVSLAKPVKKVAKSVKGKFGIGVSKFVAPTIALFCVWLSNGVWHGAGWTYIFYGMYYFVLIFIETITEAPVKKIMEQRNIDSEGSICKVLRGVKLFVIVNIGELFFRATSVTQGFEMLGRIVGKFHISTLFENNLGMDVYDVVLACLGIIIVLLVDILHEKGVSIRERIASLRLPLRWGVWYAIILSVVILGAYGAGYTVVDMIYAAY